MNYPIIKIQTADNRINHGLWLEAKGAKTVYITTHGTAGNFYNDDFIEPLADTLVANGISFLSMNNRGNGVYDIYDKSGAAVERFEDCLADIDSWVEFAQERGYQKIILSGHSLGAEKVVYYLSKDKHSGKVSGAVLISPSDSPRWRLFDEQYQPSKEGSAYINESIESARAMILSGRGDELMDTHLEKGFLPRTPAAMLNVLGEDTELLKALPFHSGRLEMLAAVTVSMCVVIGDQFEYTALPPDQALELMQQENGLVQAHLIKGADHMFAGSEERLVQTILQYVQGLGV